MIVKIIAVMATFAWLAAMPALGFWSLANDKDRNISEGDLLGSVSVGLCYPSVPFAVLMIVLMVLYLSVKPR